MGISYKSFKRIIDFAGAFLLLVFLWPLLVLLLLVSWMHYRDTPWFIQNRNGLHGRVFKLYKLRTMRHLVDQQGKLLSDEARTDRWGRFLRTYSLDELPQLINVIKGEMSLIGPRPLLPRYYHRYTDFERKRHDVLPGITGLAQVKGRNAVNWAQRFEYDVYYVQHQSLTLDLQIIVLTLRQLLQTNTVLPAAGIPIEPYDDED